ncbi:MAG: efflux transporter outer membrane subunit [Pseudomonadota bacterium]
MKRLAQFRFASCGAVLLSACTIVADPIETPAAGLTERAAFSSGVPQSSLPMVTSGWWRTFGSPELDGLIDTVAASNPDIAAASLRILQSELELGTTRAQGKPTVTAGLSRQATSATDLAGERETSTSVDLNAQVRWEADLWGRIASEGDAAAARLLATGYDRDALANSLIASVVRSYVSISFDRRQISATQRIIDSRETSLAIAEDRFALGVEGTTAGTVKSAEENLAAARADLPDLELAILRNTNALDVLMGQVPISRSDISARLPARLPGIGFSTGRPIDLLHSRPDIRAAEARLASANANINVSLADRFPALTLNGSLRSAGDLDDTLDLDNVIASLTADLLLTVFDAGRGSRLVSLRRAEAEELAQSYVATVLAAVAEVEDALAGERLLTERSRLLSARLSAAREATEIARKRYRDGTGTYLTLLDASRSEASAETAYLNVERSRWLNRIDLMLALGGAWAPGGTAREGDT